MGKIRSIFLLVALITVFAFLMSPIALAQTNFRSATLTVLQKSEVVNENYFATGDNVQISGTINGDVYTAGGNVTVDGTVNGDLLVAGGAVNINGKVAGDIRGAGGQVNLSGEVGKNVTLVGGQITINSEAKLPGSITVAGGTIDVKAPVAGSIEVAGGNLMVSNKVGENLNFAGGNLQIGPTANISGNVTYYSEQRALISESATITGETKQYMPAKEVKDFSSAGQNAGPVFFRMWMIVSFFSALVVGLLIVRFLPVFTQKTVDSIKNKFLANLGSGFIFVVVVPIAVVVLFITLLGIPLGFILLTVYFLMLYFIKIFTAVFVGQFLTRRASSKKSLYLDVFVGLVIYYLLSLIPFIGWVVQAILVLSSVGALLNTKKELFASMGDKKLI